MILNAPDGMLDSRMNEWVSLVKNAALNSSVEQLQLISDTVFASAPSSRDGLDRLVRFSQALLSDGLAKFFPIRGAIVHGEFEWGELTYGRAVIDAHELEMSQNWIGVACAPGLPHGADMWGLDKLICYVPPMKRGLMRAHPVVSWPVPQTEQLVSLVLRSNTIKEGEYLTWEVGEKINNTIQFRLYMEVLRQERASPTKFHGFFPAHAVDTILSKRGSG